MSQLLYFSIRTPVSFELRAATGIRLRTKMLTHGTYGEVSYIRLHFLFVVPPHSWSVAAATGGRLLSLRPSDRVVCHDFCL